MPRRVRTPDEEEVLHQALEARRIRMEAQMRVEIGLDPPLEPVPGEGLIIDVGEPEGAAIMEEIEAFAEGEVRMGNDNPLPFLTKKKRRKKPRIRTHVKLKGGYQLYQGGKNEDKLPWQKFIKKLLTGRPLGKKTIKEYADEITKVNNSENCQALIKTIKSHGDKFDYLPELTRAYNKRFGSRGEKKIHTGLGHVTLNTTRRTFNAVRQNTEF